MRIRDTIPSIEMLLCPAGSMIIYTPVEYSMVGDGFSEDAPGFWNSEAF